MRRVYPDKEIYDLEGNLLEDDNSSAALSSTGGPVPEDYQFPKFGNFEKDIVAYGFSWHITFKGAASANRAWKTALTIAGGSGEEQLYDSAELTRYNHPLYGDSKRRILKDGSGYYRQYSKELESQEILNRVYDFISALEKSLQEENLPTLIHLLPHKENGTLCKGRKNVLLTCSFCDHQGMSYSFFAKPLSDTAAELRVRKVYIGDPEYTRDDLFDTFRAVLPAGNPISQPGKAEETTKAPEPIKKDPAAESVNTAGQAGNTSGGSGPGIRIKKRHTAAVMSPGTEKPEQAAEELNEMEPERAKQIPEQLTTVNEVSDTLKNLSDTVSDMAGDTPVPEPGQRERILQRIHELEKERNSLKGLFSNFSRRKLQREIDELKVRLRQLRQL